MFNCVFKVFLGIVRLTSCCVYHVVLLSYFPLIWLFMLLHKRLLSFCQHTGWNGPLCNCTIFSFIISSQHHCEKAQIRTKGSPLLTSLCCMLTLGGEKLRRSTKCDCVPSGCYDRKFLSRLHKVKKAMFIASVVSWCNLREGACVGQPVYMQMNNWKVAVALRYNLTMLYSSLLFTLSYERYHSAWSHRL